MRLTDKYTVLARVHCAPNLYLAADVYYILLIAPCEV
jgi:hypothetical protein